MSIKLKIFAGVAALHLLLSLCSVLHLNQGVLPDRLGKLLYTWGEFTGSSNIYSFFAPFVGEQVSVLYTLVDSSGVQKTWMLEGANHEADTRISTIYNFVRMKDGEDLFCKSFGNTALRLNPQAQLVGVSIIEQSMPSLLNFHDSTQVPRWQHILKRDYARIEQ
jgi:hypothetical protein